MSSPPGSAATPRLNVVYFAPSEFPSSKSHTIQILNTVRAMAEAGARVTLIVKKLGATPTETFRAYGLDPHPGLRIRPLHFANKRINRWSGRSFRLHLAALMARERLARGPAIAYVRGTTLALNAIRALSPLRPILGLRTVYEMHAIQYLDLRDRHGGRFGEGEALEKFLLERREEERRAYRRLDGLVAITAGLRDTAFEDFGLACPTLIAPSGTRAAAAGSPPPPAADSPERTADVAYVGNLYGFNGVEVLIRAMALLPGRRLTIAGGPDEDLELCRAAAREARVADRVEFLGFVPHPEALALMRRAKVVTAPLMKGGFDRVERHCSPAKLAEYMASGAAIAASRLHSLCELLRNEENALLAEPNSPEALAGAIHRLLEDPALARRLAEKAAEEAAALSFAGRAERILNFLEGLSRR